MRRIKSGASKTTVAHALLRAASSLTRRLLFFMESILPALAPLGLHVPLRGAHGQVLYDAGAGGAIGAGTVRQRVVPDDEVARAPPDRHWDERAEILGARVGAGGQGVQPLFDDSMEPGDAGEGGLVGIGVGEIQDGLDAERDGLHEADVPV